MKLRKSRKAVNDNDARYIDADVLIADLTKLADGYLYAESDKDKYTFVYGALTGVRQAIRYTEAEPTADVAPKTETAREIFKEIDIIREETTGGNIMRLSFFHRLAELKKKYIGE